MKKNFGLLFLFLAVIIVRVLNKLVSKSAAAIINATWCFVFSWLFLLVITGEAFGGDYYLNATDISISAKPAYKTTGTVKATVRNESNLNGPYGGEGTFDILIIVTKPDGTQKSGYANNVSFLASQTKTISATLVFDQPGQYLLVCKTYSNNGYESGWTEPPFDNYKEWYEYKPDTSLTVSNASFTLGKPVQLRATLKAGSYVLPSKNISFNVAGKSCSSLTDASGVALCNVSPATGGTITATFSGDSSFSGCSGTGSLTAEKRSSLITANNIIVTAGENALLAARLQDAETYANLVNKTVTFSAVGKSCSGVTNSSGFASCYITPSSGGTITASFSGDATYKGKSNTATLTYNKKDTKITVSNNNGVVGDNITLVARLQDELTYESLVGKIVSFSAAGQSCSGSTNSSGFAECIIQVNQAGNHVANAVFSGNEIYNSSSGTSVTYVSQTGDQTMPVAVGNFFLMELADVPFDLAYNDQSQAILDEAVNEGLGTLFGILSTPQLPAWFSALTTLNSALTFGTRLAQLEFGYPVLQLTGIEVSHEQNKYFVPIILYNTGDSDKGIGCDRWLCPGNLQLNVNQKEYQWIEPDDKFEEIAYLLTLPSSPITLDKNKVYALIPRPSEIDSDLTYWVYDPESMPEDHLGFGIKKEFDNHYLNFTAEFWDDLGLAGFLFVNDTWGHDPDDDHGDNFDDATPYSLQGNQQIEVNGNLYQEDTDVFKLIVDEEMDVFFVIMDSNGDETNAYISLKDIGGNPLDSSNLSINYVLESGEYFIEVKGQATPLGAGGYGDYYLRFDSNVSDNDSVSDTEEKGPDGIDEYYDGNSDGTADYTQGNVASLYTYNGDNYVTIATPEEHDIVNLKATELPDDAPEAPNQADLIFGCFDFYIKGIENGGSTTVTMFLPEGSSVDSYYKFGPTPDNTEPHWYEFLYDGQTGAEIIGNKIILHFVDGQRGDSDLINFNGSIKDPGGPVAIKQTGDLDGHIEATPKIGFAPLTTDFTFTVTSGTPPYIYSWSFGDGSTSTIQNPSHIYSSEGSYIAQLTATDSSGQTTISAVSIQVNTSVAQADYVILTDTSPNTTIASGRDIKIYGSSGINGITLESGSKAELINVPGSNTVTISADASLFTVSRSGTVVTFEGNDGTKLKIPANTSVQTITFSDRAPMTLSIYQGQVMLDDQVVSTVPALIAEGSETELETFTNSLGMTFVGIPAGTFMMGSSLDEPGRSSDEDLHQVSLTQEYFMQTTEVTQGQWEVVMGSNPSYFLECGANCPVEMVSWNDVQDFITRMNQRGEGTYALPTEAQWEYAARAGAASAFANGPISTAMGGQDPVLETMGWYNNNSDYKTHPVAQKVPNAWGLYDMHGNVLEWVFDWYAPYPEKSVEDPKGPDFPGIYRVQRGGSWIDPAHDCRSTARFYNTTSGFGSIMGFRLVFTPVTEKHTLHIENAGFENGTTGWFAGSTSEADCIFTVDSNAFEGNKSAKISLNNQGYCHISNENPISVDQSGEYVLNVYTKSKGDSANYLVLAVWKTEDPSLFPDTLVWSERIDRQNNDTGTEYQLYQKNMNLSVGDYIRLELGLDNASATESGYVLFDKIEISKFGDSKDESDPAGNVIKGVLKDVGGSLGKFYWGDGKNDLYQEWSVHTQDNSGWFYGSSSTNADVYVYKFFSDPTSVKDASIFDYSTTPVVAEQGDTVFFRGINGFYGAWVILDIFYDETNLVDGSSLNGKWFFIVDGSADFTGTAETFD